MAQLEATVHLDVRHGEALAALTEIREMVNSSVWDNASAEQLLVVLKMAGLRADLAIASIAESPDECVKTIHPDKVHVSAGRLEVRDLPNGGTEITLDGQHLSGVRSIALSRELDEPWSAKMEFVVLPGPVDKDGWKTFEPGPGMGDTLELDGRSAPVFTSNSAGEAFEPQPISGIPILPETIAAAAARAKREAFRPQPAGSSEWQTPIVLQARQHLAGVAGPPELADAAPPSPSDPGDECDQPVEVVEPQPIQFRQWL